MKNKYIAVYESLFEHDYIHDDDPRKEAIIAEMQGIESAKTNAEAFAVVEWWGWDSRQKGISFVLKARKMMEANKQASPLKTENT